MKSVFVCEYLWKLKQKKQILILQALAGGLKVGIVGIGGLGQMGVILAKAMGK